MVCVTGELAHALRFLASVVSQSFIAFGDILELHKKFLELSGGINRIFELEELTCAAQRSKFRPFLFHAGELCINILRRKGVEHEQNYTS